MDQFGYLSVLISIILGLAVTQLITGVGRLVQYRARIDFYWPSLAWVGVLLVIDVQSWWALFSLRELKHWTFLGFLVVLAHPLALFLLSALAAPDSADFIGERRIDLKANYSTHSRWFFGAIMLAIVASLVRPLALTGRLPLDLDAAAQLFWFALAAGGIVTKNPGYHKFMAVVFPLTLALYIAALFGKL